MLRSFRNLSVSRKAYALSGLLLLSLFGLGYQASWVLGRSNAGLRALTSSTLPKQAKLKNVLQQAVRTHVDLFRFVSWSSSGINSRLLEGLGRSLRNSASDLTVELERLRVAPDLSEAEHRAITRALATWRRYATVTRDIMEIADGDPALGTTMLGGADEDYRNAARDLEAISTLASREAEEQTADIVEAGERDQAALILGGIVATLLLLGGAAILLGSIVRPIRLVTRALEGLSRGSTSVDLANDERQDEIGQMIRAIRTFRDELGRRQLELQQNNYRFQALIDHMDQGLSMFDSGQRLIILNRRYAQMFRLPAELTRPGTTLQEIRDFRVRDGSAHKGDANAFVHATVAGNGPRSYVSELADGRFVAFRSVQMADGGWVGTHEDVTALHKTQHALAEERTLLAAALQNMSQGLAIFDASRTLVVSNARYAELYGLPPELARRGTTQRQLLEHRVKSRGWVGSHVEKILHDRLGSTAYDEPSDLTVEFPDGQIIAVSHRPMPNGGLVSTHEDITLRRRTEAQVTHMARHDALTGLPNRLLFRDCMETALARVQTTGCAAAVLCVDLDHFKPVNDTLGHPVGDALLREVAGRLKSCLSSGDGVARLGGDEFAVLQVDLGDPDDAARLAHRIVGALGAPYDVEGHNIIIGASVGIALAPQDGADPNQLLKHADMALYRAKGEGRGRYRYFETAMDALAQTRRALQLDLRKALRDGEFELYYQPVVRTSDVRVTGFEALIRWNHPVRGLVPPLDFIPIAEEMGLIVPIGEWVIRAACVEAAGWERDLTIAVNLSPAQFRGHNILATVVRALADSGLPASRLDVEITESVLLNDSDTTLATLHALRALGVHISLDDFGTGYSSLSYLRSFPFDKIKIDRSFVRDLGHEPDCQAIVRAVIALAHSLDMRTLAEGVETSEHFDQLLSEGCEEVQGYLFSPPVPASELSRFLASPERHGADAAHLSARRAVA